MAITTKKNAFIEESDNNENQEYTNDFDFPVKSIFMTYIARGLIRKYHHVVVDIMPYKGNPDRTVFVFRDSLQLRDDMQKVIKSQRRKADGRKSEESTEEIDNG